MFITIKSLLFHQFSNDLFDSTFLYEGKIWTTKLVVQVVSITSKYFIGRVILFFANNYLTEYRNNMEFLHIFKALT